jgi:UDP-GlcNAc:undecaprenyl-phosphate GlcNAc-1-phosphate transferase
VLIIYAFSALFGFLAILFSYSTTLISLIITVAVIFVLHVFAELAGIVMGGKRPVVSFLRRILRKFQRKRSD